MTGIDNILKQQREYFAKGETRDINFRLKALRTLKETIKKYEEEICEALKKDLNKVRFEAYATEVGFIYTELNDVIRKLPGWSRVKKVKTPVAQFKSTSYIVSEPYGVVLIMSPWNYPFQLSIAPLIGAIAGGNCAVVKPSAYSSHTSSIIKKIIEECFESKFVSVIEGGREANSELLSKKFDYIFFTGSVGVGKIVMEAASKHLTPVTLELGGKSPCIVHRDTNIDVSARRIIWGKTINSGQTCVAPDYCFAHKDIKGDLITAMKKYIKEFYGDVPCRNPEYPRIVNERHFSRLKGLLSSGDIVAGGDFNEETLQISPVILDNVSLDSPVMQEEIFGPILPVIEYDDIEQVISYINSRPKPLALYLFTGSKELEKMIVKRVSFGGGCINDTLVHLATSEMPFGGVGESGMGGYHGKWSFDTFTHKKSIMRKSFLIDIELRYPPYRNKLSMLKKIMK
ncbi:MAG: aldehyde dehydrogenase [Clostridiaceae bacterium]|nr:aldehyde dehydrogenase [Clostridiaceae bacterium]